MARLLFFFCQLLVGCVTMSERRVHSLLGFLVIFDVTLTLWAFAFPELWFRVFHGVPYAVCNLLLGVVLLKAYRARVAGPIW